MIAFILHASKAMLKILQARLQLELRMSRCKSWVYKKAEEREIKLPTFAGSWRKQRNSRKASTSASLNMLKSLIVWMTKNCGKIVKRWEYQTTLTISWEICTQVNNQQLDLDMEQLTGSNLVKEYDKATHCHLDYLTSMQSTLGFPGGTVVKNSLDNAGDTGDVGSIAGLRRYSEVGKGNQIQDYCWKIPTEDPGRLQSMIAKG